MNTEKRKTYDERQKIGAWLWWVGPGLLVALAVIGYNASPFEDGIDLEPQTRAEVAVKTDEADDGAQRARSAEGGERARSATDAEDAAKSADDAAETEGEASADDDAPKTDSAKTPADDSSAPAKE